jgi:N-methylhydantoinase A
VEIVSARLRSTGIVEKLSQRRAPASQKRQGKPANYVTAYLEGKKLRVAVYQRNELKPGMRLSAPCIVTEYSSTTLIPPSAQAEVDSFGNLLIRL